ncbi:transcription initiation factor TFIID 23-30kDa subunit-domain-containing protein [Morchella snyderi]|nr:transcription initiation factor TFIID 23-30kDa subunit-domain-containing protein [Morchella snyderi]
MTNSSDPSQPAIKSENTPENTLPDVDVDMENATNATQQDPLAGAGDRIPAPAPVAARKDRNLREFLGMMDEYAPIIPDAVTDYYLSLSGLSTTDPRLKRLLALATQKFIADIATDAYQYSRIRQNSSNASGVPGIGALNVGIGGGAGGAGGGTGGGGSFRPIARPGFGGGGGSGGSAGRTVLTMEDLGSAVGEYGVNTRRPEFYR